MGVALPLTFLWVLFFLSLELAHGVFSNWLALWTLYNRASADLEIFVKRGTSKNWWLLDPLAMSPAMNEAAVLRMLRGFRKVRGPDFHQPAMRSSKSIMENGGGVEKVSTSSGEIFIGA